MTSRSWRHSKPATLLVLLLLIGGLSSAHARAATPLRLLASTDNASLPIDWSYQGADNGEEMGRSVSGAGDTDKDGFADALVGAPLASTATQRSGAVHVFLGPVGPVNPDHTLAGPHRGSHFGEAVASAGDVDGDGYDDVIVGAPSYKAGDEMPDAGAAYVYYGPLAGSPPPPDLAIIGQQRDIKLGAAVAGAGDINGDTYDDVLIGAPLGSGGQTNEGQVFILYGSATGLVTATMQTLEMDQAYARFGAAVAGAGDVNGDTYSDVIIGAPSYDSGDGNRYGAAFLFLGSSLGLSTTVAWEGFGSQAAITTAGYAMEYGAVVGTAGNVNGDSYDDWFVSAPGWDDDYLDQGGVQVFHGRMGTLGGVVPAWSRTMITTGARFGAGASGAGDVNNDGYDDLIVGVPYYEDDSGGSGGKNDPEVSQIYLGSPHGLRSFRAWELVCNQSTTDFGASVAGAGDMDKDGHDDLLVGAPHYKRDSDLPGEAFGYLGIEGDGVFFSAFLPLVMR